MHFLAQSLEILSVMLYLKSDIYKPILVDLDTSMYNFINH